MRDRTGCARRAQWLLIRADDGRLEAWTLSKMIRLGVPADLPAVSDVFRRASLSNSGDRADLLAHPEHLIFGPEGLNAGRTHVAEEDGSVVGFATWTDADGGYEL